MWARASASSGSMWTNCDEVQQAVHPSQGTADSSPSRIAPSTEPSQAEKSPASTSPSSPSDLRTLRIVRTG